MKKEILLITETDNFDQNTLSKLRKKFDVIFGVTSKKDMIRKLVNSQYLLVRLKYFLDKELLSYSKSLREIYTPTTGLNHIDTDYLRKRKIDLVSLRNYKKEIKNISATAELTIGLILNLTRNISEAKKHVEGFNWNRNLFLGNDLSGKKLGVIGYGRIGKTLSRLAKSFRMHVMYFDQIKSRRNVTLKYLCKTADIISIHIDYKKENHNFFDEKYFSLMKRDSLLVNTSRGEVLNHEHLLNFLKKKKIKGAALDVLENEHLFLTNLHKKIISYAKNNHNLIITPHIGGYTKESLQKAENIVLGRLLT